MEFSGNDRAQLAVDGGKAASTWAFAGMSASDLAALAAFVYTCLLICEWVWKKAIKPHINLLRRRRRGD